MAGTLYDVLGVGQGASAQEVRIAYRQAVLRAHPDKAATAAAAAAAAGAATESAAAEQRQQQPAEPGPAAAEPGAASNGPLAAAAAAAADAAAVNGAADGFLALQRAWEVLGDPQRRREYDRQLALDASRQEVQVNEDVPLSTLRALGEEEVAADFGEPCLAWPCRCGGAFLLPAGDEALQWGGGAAEAVLVPCSTCSLFIQVQLDR